MPTKKPTPTTTDLDKADQLGRDFASAQRSMGSFRGKWDEFLNIAYARLSTERGFRSRVREGSLSSLLWERAARVAAQLPTGKIQALTSKDTGKSQLMDLVWHRYVVPNANTDYSFLTKLRLWDYYSFIYGAMPAFYDYRVDDEYVGPDFTLIDPRFCYPQGGRLSLQRCEYVFITAFHGKKYLKGKLGMDGWNDKSINEILSEYSANKQPGHNNLNNTTSTFQSDRGQSIDMHNGEIELVTKYERGKNGHWITFAPEYGNVIVRDIPNPHKNGRIPVVFKYCFPLIDSIWGMGDVERGESLQKAVDTSVNLSLDFGKFKLYPPMYYTDGVNASQLRYEPGAKWKLPNQGAAGFMPVSGSYSQEFQSMYQFLKGALLNQNGTTDTTISSEDKNPGFGKTPGAIQKLQARENSRDNWDRNMLEDAFSDLTEGMINLIGSKQPKSIDFHIFEEEITAIVDAGYKDVLELYDSAKGARVTDEGELETYATGKGTAKVTVSPKDMEGTYKYIIDSGTSMAKDDNEEHQNLEGLIMMLGTPAGQLVMNKTQEEGRPIQVTELFKRYLISGGTKNWEEILPDQAQKMGEQGQQFNPNMIQDPRLQALMQSQGQPQMPPQGSPQGQPQPPAPPMAPPQMMGAM